MFYKFDTFFQKNGPTSASFFIYFWSFHTNITKFYNKYMWINVQLVYGAGIWTHGLWKVSLLP